MATKTYVAKQVRQYETHALTVTAVAVGGKIGLTINSKNVSYTCVTGDTTATAASGLVAAIRAAVDQEFQQFSISTDGTVANQINITESEAGVYLTPDGNTALTVTSSGGATITAAVAQPGLSPADASDVLNWSGAALPANSGDDWVFEDAPFPAWYQLSALSGKAAASLTVKSTFGGNGIGLPKYNQSGGYLEYLGGRLTLVSCATMDLNVPSGAGYESYRFDVGGTVACNLWVKGDGNGTVGSEAVDWLGTNAANTVEVDGGSLKVAMYVGEVATINTLNIVAGAVSLGSGVTVTTIKAKDSALALNCAAATLEQDQDQGTAQTTVKGTGTLGTLEIKRGSVFHNGTGTITTLVVGPGATIDFSGTKEPITITNVVQIHVGGTLWDPWGRVTMTAGYQPVECTHADIVVNNGKNRTYTYV